MYKEIEKMRTERDEHIKQVQELDDEIKYKLLELRIEDTKDVLYFIHSYRTKISDRDMDCLITHCCNKLSGNLDSIKLNLNKERWLKKQEEEI